MSRGSIPLIALLLILLSSAIIGAFYFYGKSFINSKPLPTSKPTDAPTQKPPEPPDEIANWKTHRNKEYNFEFRYPPKFQIRESNDGVVVESEPRTSFGTCNGERFGVTLKNFDLEERLKPNSYQKTVTDTEVDGRNATLIQYGSNLEGLKCHSSYLIPKTSDGKEASYYIFMSREAKYDDSQLNKILSTFKFLDSGQLVVDDTEKARIDIWIEENNLNQYGDPNDIVYTGGTPLFDEATGETKDRYDYIVEKHPDRPWNKNL